MAVIVGKFAKSLINRTAKDVIDGITSNSIGSKTIDLDEDWSIVVNYSQLYVLHKHGAKDDWHDPPVENRRVQGLHGLAGCSCPIPPQIRVLVSMYSLDNNLNVIRLKEDS